MDAIKFQFFVVESGVTKQESTPGYVLTQVCRKAQNIRLSNFKHLKNILMDH